MTQAVKLRPLPIASTFSKDPRFFAKGFTPTTIDQGYGSRVRGSDGEWYIDWISALGSNLLGYGNPDFVRRIQQEVAKGVNFSLPCPLEQAVAEKLVTLLGKHVPGWTPEGLGVRFGKTGTDATTMAVRLARAVTGRVRCLTFGYHGWADWSVSVTPPAWGIHPKSPLYVEEFPFNDTERVEVLLQAVPYAACVILEQPMVDPLPGYYEQLCKVCTEHGTLLILDEMVTWPRWALGGTAEYYGVEPDIACYGKALGNGIPISCIVGRREYFDWFDRNDPVFVSSTHFGEALGLAAADVVLDKLDDKLVRYLWDIGQALMDGLKQAGYNVIGHPPRSLIQFDSPAEKGYFTLGMRDRGVLMNRPNLPNMAHTLADVNKTVQAAAEVKALMDKEDVAAVMAGKEPEVLFANR